MPGDVLFEGKANHHWRTERGWTYSIRIVMNHGKQLLLESCFIAAKATLKAQDVTPKMLKGPGDMSAMVRIAHGVCVGLKVTIPE